MCYSVIKSKMEMVPILCCLHMLGFTQATSLTPVSASWRNNIYINSGEKLSFKFGFKAPNRVTLSDVSREVTPEEGGMIGKGPADFFLTLGTDKSPVFSELRARDGT